MNIDSTHPSDRGESSSPPDGAALMRRFREYLDALCDPRGGSALHGMHAADAPLRHADGLNRASEIDPEAFARAHRDVSLAGADRLPAFRDPVLLAATATASAEGRHSVAWFDVHEAGQARRIVAALGVRTVDGVPAIVWCTAAERVEPWSFGEGLARSLADYPWMRKSDPALPRALLDAAYFRRYGRAPPRFSTLPEARFGCRMSAGCCKHDYEITLPREAQLLIDAIPWQRIKPELVQARLPQRPDGTLQLKRVDETCRFLGPVNQCLIHQALGRQPFAPCCIFPFSFARTPEGIAVGLSPVCGSVRAGLGPGPQEEDLRERLALADPRSTDVYRLAPDVEIPWERFRDIEKALCDCLAAGDAPMRRRLYVGARLLDALRGGRPVDLNEWLAEPVPAITAELGEAVRGMLARLIGWDRAVLRRLPRQIPADLARHEVHEPAPLAQILRNTLYCKVYSYPFDLTTAYNHLIVLYLLALLMQASAAPLSQDMWRELGSLGVHGLLTSMLHADMPEGFRALLGTAQFGLWMLAA